MKLVSAVVALFDDVGSNVGLELGPVDDLFHRSVTTRTVVQTVYRMFLADANTG